MAYTGSGSFGGIRFNDPATAKAYQKGEGYYTTMPGIDPNKPGWGDLVPAGYELVGYKAPKMSGNSRSINRAPVPGTSYAVLRKRSSAPASAPAPAPAQQAAQPLYGKQYSYTDPGDKGYFGMKDYQELAAQGASRADMIRYAFSAPKGVGTKVAEQLGIRAFDAPIPSSLSYTDPGDTGFFGMKDFEELSRQGATLQQIKDYASKAKYGVGGEAASILGIRAATEGDFTRAQGDKLAADLENQRIQDEKAAALQRELAIKSQATLAANMARSGQTPNLQIQPASGTPRTAGTQSFRRQRGPVAPAVLSGISSVLNI